MRSKVDAARYVKVIVPRKAKVKTRLMYNCIASAKQALRSGGVSDASVTQKKNEARKRVPFKPSVDEQVGMIADIGVSSSKFKKLDWALAAPKADWRAFLPFARSGTGSRPWSARLSR